MTGRIDSEVQANMIFLKTEQEIVNMRRCNRIVAQVLKELAEMARPGR